MDKENVEKKKGVSAKDLKDQGFTHKQIKVLRELRSQTRGTSSEQLDAVERNRLKFIIWAIEKRGSFIDDLYPDLKITDPEQKEQPEHSQTPLEPASLP